MTQNHQKTCPLVVDLDDTLIKTDLFIEALICLRVVKLNIVLGLLRYLFSKPKMKQYLAKHCKVKFELLPYNFALLEYISKEKTKGRRIILATGAASEYANGISEYLGLFDDVISTTEKVNLTGANKVKALENMLGDTNYEYVGSNGSDKIIWRTANYATCTNCSKKIEKWLFKTQSQPKIIGENKKVKRSLFAALRLHQWSKNCLLFIPLIASHQYNNLNTIKISLLGFILFSIMVSSTYFLNDLIDLENDRRHPAKKFRKIPNGDLPISLVVLLMFLLAITAITLSSIFLPIQFVFTMFIYLLLSGVYSLNLKKKYLLDAISIAVLFFLRMVAGVYLIETQHSMLLAWLVLFLFFSLALVKRVGELNNLGFLVNQQKMIGRFYSKNHVSLLTILGIVSGITSVIPLLIYLFHENSIVFYSDPTFLLVIAAFLLAWIIRIWFITVKGAMTSDPVLFALKDNFSWFIAAGIIVSFVIAI